MQVQCAPSRLRIAANPIGACRSFVCAAIPLPRVTRGVALQTSWLMLVVLSLLIADGKGGGSVAVAMALVHIVVGFGRLAVAESIVSSSTAP